MYVYNTGRITFQSGRALPYDVCVSKAYINISLFEERDFHANFIAERLNFELRGQSLRGDWCPTSGEGIAKWKDNYQE